MKVTTSFQAAKCQIMKEGRPNRGMPTNCTMKKGRETKDERRKERSERSNRGGFGGDGLDGRETPQSITRIPSALCASVRKEPPAIIYHRQAEVNEMRSELKRGEWPITSRLDTGWV
jgi:hypothetical protein